MTTINLEYVMDGIHCTRRMVYDILYEKLARLDDNINDKKLIIDGIMKRLEDPNAKLEKFKLIKSNAIFNALYKYLTISKWMPHEYNVASNNYNIYYKTITNKDLQPIFIHISNSLSNDFIYYKTKLTLLKRRKGFILWCKVPAIKQKIKETDEQFINRLSINIDFEMIEVNLKPNDIVIITQNIKEVLSEIKNGNFKPNVGACKSLTSYCKFYHLCWSEKLPETIRYKSPNKEIGLYDRLENKK